MPRCSYSAATNKQREVCDFTAFPTGGIHRLTHATTMDVRVVVAIRAVLADSLFCGEGYRKVRARLLRVRAFHFSGMGFLRILLNAGLLAPQRARRRRTPRPQDGTIIPAEPNQRWGGGCGCSSASITSAPRHGPMWPRSGPPRRPPTALRRPGSPLGVVACRRRPGRRRTSRLGIAVPLGPLHRFPALAGHGGRSRLRRRAGDEWMCRALDQNLEGAVPVGPPLRRDRRAAPSGGRLRRDVQTTSGSSSATGIAPRERSTSPSLSVEAA